MSDSLTLISREIELLLQSIQLRPTMETVIRVGELLTRAKRLCGHGKWLSWLKVWGIADRTARTYMQVANRQSAADLPETVSVNAFLKQMRAADKESILVRRREAIKQARRKLAKTEDNWQVVHTDCREFQWPELDAIFTDPPWDDHTLYTWLADMALNNLKEGGLLVVQCGQVDLPAMFEIFRAFHYQWTLSMVYHNSFSANFRFLVNWRPLLVFSKGENKIPSCVTDAITVNDIHRFKRMSHDWEQPLMPYARWIEGLTQPGELIADPFACTGTIGVACKMTGRRYIGAEINEDMVHVARQRIAETK